MYKYHFIESTKHSVFIIYEEFDGYFLHYSYEDYGGKQIKSFVTSNLPDEVDCKTISYTSNYLFREKFDIGVVENNVPDNIVEYACNDIERYFRF